MPANKPSFHETSARRIKEIRASMKSKNLDAYVVSHLPTIRYLTNFSGSNGLLIICGKSVHFFTDDRYREQIKTELYSIHNLKTHIERDMWGFIADKGILSKGQVVGFESNFVSVDTLKTIKKKIGGAKFVGVPMLATKTTIAKSADEIAKIQKAADIAAKAYEYILGFVKPGMREMDVALELSYKARTFGSEGDAFEIIFVAGDHGAFVHGRATERKIKKGEVITLDFGCRYMGFNSDMTRTFSLGKPSDNALKAWSAVTEAHKRAIELIHADVFAKDLDALARKIIGDAGFGQYFQHSLGHGLGIEVHEPPGISIRNEKGQVPENAVITIEPGIYIPGEFGMRLEDDVLVTKDGGIMLTSSPREMIRL